MRAAVLEQERIQRHLRRVAGGWQMGFWGRAASSSSVQAAKVGLLGSSMGGGERHAAATQQQRSSNAAATQQQRSSNAAATQGGPPRCRGWFYLESAVSLQGLVLPSVTARRPTPEPPLGRPRARLLARRARPGVLLPGVFLQQLSGPRGKRPSLIWSLSDRAAYQKS